MITADNDYYATLKAAGEIVEHLDAHHLRTFEYETNTAWAVDMMIAPFARALLDVEERRQLALGELGEAMMVAAGDVPYDRIERAADILAGRIEV